MQVADSVIYRTLTPRIPLAQKPVTPQPETGGNPYTGLVNAYMASSKSSGTGDVFSHTPARQPDQWEKITLPDNIARKGMGLILRDATEIAPSVPGFTQIWTHAPLPDFSEVSALTPEDAEAQYAAALKNGLTLEEMQKLMENDTEGKSPGLDALYNTAPGEDRPDIKTVTQGGSVLTLLTPPPPLYGPENFGLQLTTKGGFQLTLPLEEDARITEYENGNISLYYPATGSRKVYDVTGKAISADGMESWKTTGQDIIVNSTGGQLDAGDGDDIIFNLAENTEIKGNDGDKTVFMLNKENKGTKLALGNGNNTFFGHKVADSEFTLGEGTNSILALRMNGCTVNGGSGDVAIISNTIQNSNIYLANSNNSIRALRFFENINISTGSGNNSIYSGSTNNSTIKTGDGDNYIIFSSMSDTNMHIGDGDNYIYSGYVTGSTINSGHGNNDIKISSMSDTNMYTGDGDNRISINYSSASKVVSGNGDNNININSSMKSSIHSGNGNNNISIINTQDVKIITGNGQNYFTSDSFLGSSVESGDGRNSIYVRSMDRNSHVTVGDGKNNIEIPIIGGGTIHAGNGGNTISVEQGTGNIISGSGSDTLYLSSHFYDELGAVIVGGGNNTVYIRNPWTYQYDDKSNLFRG